jgi:hypothetical protein
MLSGATQISLTASLKNINGAVEERTGIQGFKMSPFVLARIGGGDAASDTVPPSASIEAKAE